MAKLAGELGVAINDKDDRHEWMTRGDSFHLANCDRMRQAGHGDDEGGRGLRASINLGPSVGHVRGQASRQVPHDAHTQVQVLREHEIHETPAARQHRELATRRRDF
jgi:hypothetical protein